MVVAKSREGSRTGGARPLRYSRGEFIAAAEGGAFGERRVELLDGEVFEKMGQLHAHRASLMLTAEALRAVFGAGYVVRMQLPLPLGVDSQPEPDLSVLRGSARDFAQREEGPEDTALVVEIADSRRDTALRKRKLYSVAGIAEYWIVDLRQRALVVHTDPTPKGYATVRTYGAEDIGPHGVPVANLLP